MGKKVKREGLSNGASKRFTELELSWRRGPGQEGTLICVRELKAQEAVMSERR